MATLGVRGLPIAAPASKPLERCLVSWPGGVNHARRNGRCVTTWAFGATHGATGNTEKTRESFVVSQAPVIDLSFQSNIWTVHLLQDGPRWGVLHPLRPYEEVDVHQATG